MIGDVTAYARGVSRLALGMTLPLSRGLTFGERHAVARFARIVDRAERAIAPTAAPDVRA